MNQLGKYESDNDGYTLKNPKFDYEIREIYKKQRCKWLPTDKKWILPYFDIFDKKISEEHLNFLKKWGILEK